MLDAGWPALLAALSFLLNMNLSDSLFGDVLGALQSLTAAAGCLTMPTPCGAFFIAFIKAALPPHVVAALDESPDTDNALTCFAQGFYFGPGQRGQSTTAAGAQRVQFGARNYPHKSLRHLMSHQTPTPRSPVSLKGLTLGLASVGSPLQLPGLSVRNLAHETIPTCRCSAR